MPRHLPILLIMILAALPRLHGLAHDSLWGDESLSVLLAKMNLYDLVKNLTAWEQIPPAHHILLHYWIKLFGDSEFSVRMPSVLAGVGSVWMTCVVVGRMMPRRVALLSALMVAVSPSMIEYAQECRAYALLVLVSLVSTDLFLRLLRRPTQRLHAAYVLISTLLLYTHLYGLFVVLAHHLVYGWRWLRSRRANAPARPEPRAWLTDNLAIAALYSPWLPVVAAWSDMVIARGRFWVTSTTLDDITRSYWFFSGSTAMFCVVMTLAGLAVVRWWKREGFWTLVTLALVPVVVPIIISLLTRPTYAPRYALVAGIGMAAVAAAGLAAIRPAAIRTIVAIGAAAGFLLGPWGNAADIPKADWRRAGAFLNRNMRPGDLAVIHLRVGSRLYHYYVDRPDVQARFVDNTPIPVTLPLEQGRRVWLVIYAPWFPANHFLSRAPWHIERRLLIPELLVMELTDQPASDAATCPPAPPPAPAPATTPASPTPSSANPRPSAMP